MLNSNCDCTNNMETLSRIQLTFDNIKKLCRNRESADWMHTMKRDIQALGTELVMLGKENHDMYVRSLAMEGYLALLTAKVLSMNTMEKQKLLKDAFERLKPYSLRGECLFIFLRIQNLLCFYLLQLDHTTICREILENMEELYDEVNKSQNLRFLDAEDLFTNLSIQLMKPLSPDKIDKVITNNIQMQAFVYNKLNLPEKYVLYNHTALRRQLEMKEGTPQEWALRTARLGNYFAYLSQFANARHHLCAAYHVLRTCHDKCKLVPTSFVLHKADFEMHFLELSHHWVKYGLNLFKVSKKHILNRYFARSTSKADLWKTVDLVEKGSASLSEKLDDENAKDTGVEKKGKGDCSSQNLFSFPALDLKSMETKIPVCMVTDVEDARKTFVFTHKWLMRSKRYYDFEQQAAQYTACGLQLAELYEHLAFFERSVENQYRIQRRRADVLENLNSLLKTCDNMMTIQIDVIRELSQVQLELMALNLQKLWCEESHVNILNLENDTDSIMNSLDSSSNKTFTEKNVNVTSKNIFLRKMEAASVISSRLFRLSDQLAEPSSCQFDIEGPNSIPNL